ncbi:hypothetical protein SAMN05444156_0239 [Verrucomicrobium sp. GAS474]|uniref:NAD(P)/FAD-dependent oxidoreductase n=1 Tax=Verrucomicrobium sp. GAS474 TaxID=1882831 RepID=UPI00087A9BEF|nr:TIGR03862 family flavoprotein [Verrucomicrobium sp. GAS474]SDT86851.1 hypothetical protein SAMN05444156_0239 [Verrucomicrobium sp. GAS474]
MDFPRIVAVIGGGPAGLRAAEVAAEAGCAVTVFDHKPSPGRKFLLAGVGGLNLTHSEPLEKFVPRYRGGEGRWPALLADFDPEALRAWAAELGVPTFVGTSGRVFPEAKKAAPLLRAWTARLKKQGVAFRFRHAWRGWEETGDGSGLHLLFESEGNAISYPCTAAVLALGGASYPETGSDGGWVSLLAERGIPVAPWRAANCGYEVAGGWPAPVLAAAEGMPLKNIALTVGIGGGRRRVEGECLVTRYGIEGSAVYALGAAIRESLPREIRLDFKSTLSVDELLRRAGTPPRDPAAFLATAAPRWRLGPAATALLEWAESGSPSPTPAALAARVKDFPLALGEARPVAEAISSAGGIAWEALDENLMLRAIPGLFAAGEMIDWEAPTGGYLLQGSFATGTRAGRGAAEYRG